MPIQDIRATIIQENYDLSIGTSNEYTSELLQESITITPNLINFSTNVVSSSYAVSSSRSETTLSSSYAVTSSYALNSGGGSLWTSSLDGSIKRVSDVKISGSLHVSNSVFATSFGLGTEAPTGYGVATNICGILGVLPEFSIQSSIANKNYAFVADTDGTFYLAKTGGSTYFPLFFNPTTEHLGIGTLSPNATLHVNGDVEVSGSTHFGNSATDTHQIKGKVNIYTGTGTDIPILITSTSANYSLISFNNTESVTQLNGIWGGTDGALVLNVPVGGTIYYRVGNDTKYTMNSSGDILGSGFLNASYGTFTIPGMTQPIRIWNNGNYGAISFNNNASGSAISGIWGSTTELVTNAPAQHYLRIGNSDHMNITTNNVAVQVPIDIKQGMKITGSLEVSGSTHFGNTSTDTHQFTGSVEIKSATGQDAVNAFTMTNPNSPTNVGKIWMGEPGSFDVHMKFGVNPLNNNDFIMALDSGSGVTGASFQRWIMMANETGVASKQNGNCYYVPNDGSTNSKIAAVNQIIFMTQYQPKMVIDTTGNVGVGNAYQYITPKHQLEVTGDTAITGSLLVTGSAIFNAPIYRSKQPRGTFYTSASITFNGTTTASINYDNTASVDNLIWSASQPSRIYVVQDGNYKIDISAIADTGTANKHCEIWLAENGVNLPDSNTIVQLPNASTEVVIAVPFLLPLSSGSYIEVKGWGDASDVKLLGTPTQGTGASARPACPSIITTMYKL